MSGKNQVFEVYRYLLLPLKQKQIEIFGKKYTANEIRDIKNQVFSDVLSTFLIDGWRSSRYELSSKVIYDEDDWFVFQLGRKKEIEVTLRNLVKKEEVEDWPAATIVINNRLDTQVICVSKDTGAFSSTQTVINILQENLRDRLNRYGLMIDINKTFYHQDFWKMIKENEGDIRSLKFEFVSPNMANLNSELMVDLKGFRDKNNSQRTSLELSVDIKQSESSIEVSEEDEDIQKMVNYVSEGAGDITLHRRSKKEGIKMNENVRKIEIDESLLSENPDLWVDWDSVLSDIKRVVK